MSRIGEMVRDMCPDGVEYQMLGACTLPVDRIDWSREERLPYIDLSSVDRFAHRIHALRSITGADAPSRAQQIVRAGDVLFGTTRPALNRYASVPAALDGAVCSTGFCVLRADTARVLPGWLLYMVSSRGFRDHVEQRQQGTSYPSISDKEVKACPIPVPPLPIQRETMRILDAITEREAALENDLEAELDARRKECEYYRDRILDFPRREARRDCE